MSEDRRVLVATAVNTMIGSGTRFSPDKLTQVPLVALRFEFKGREPISISLGEADEALEVGIGLQSAALTVLKNNKRATFSERLRAAVLFFLSYQ